MSATTVLAAEFGGEHRGRRAHREGRRSTGAYDLVTARHPLAEPEAASDRLGPEIERVNRGTTATLTPAQRDLVAEARRTLRGWHGPIGRVLFDPGRAKRMRIRQLDDEEDRALGLPLQAYAFRSSPTPPGDDNYLRELQPYLRDNLILAVEEDGDVIAQASGIPMRQNVRGLVCAMAGVAGVVSHPLSRRRGHVRALLTELLGRMRDSGHAVSTLHPFRPSFYQRFGYVTLPKSRTVRFSPSDLTPLLDHDLPGEVTMVPVADGYDTYLGFLDTMMARQHGFAVLPDGRMELLRDRNNRWLATAHDGGQVVGMTMYHITEYGGQLITDDLLATNALGRTLLLRFFAQHRDQVASTAGPAEHPELWLTDLQVVAETAVTLPQAPPPMGRVLSLDALAGMPVGPGRVVVELVDDPFLAGSYLLDGRSGTLEVSAGTGAVTDAVLTTVGLSGLLYGVLDSEQIVIHGLGTIPAEAAIPLDRLFPHIVPRLSVAF